MLKKATKKRPTMENFPRKFEEIETVSEKFSPFFCHIKMNFFLMFSGKFEKLFFTKEIFQIGVLLHPTERVSRFNKLPTKTWTKTTTSVLLTPQNQRQREQKKHTNKDDLKRLLLRFTEGPFWSALLTLIIANVYLF